MNKKDNRKGVCYPHKKLAKKNKLKKSIRYLKINQVNGHLCLKCQSTVSNKITQCARMNVHKKIIDKVNDDTSSPHWPMAKVCLTIKDTPQYSMLQSKNPKTLSSIRKFSKIFADRIKKTVINLSILLH